MLGGELNEDLLDLLLALHESGVRPVVEDGVTLLGGERVEEGLRGAGHRLGSGGRVGAVRGAGVGGVVLGALVGGAAGREHQEYEELSHGVPWVGLLGVVAPPPPTRTPPESRHGSCAQTVAERGTASRKKATSPIHRGTRRPPRRFAPGAPWSRGARCSQKSPHSRAGSLRSGLGAPSDERRRRIRPRSRRLRAGPPASYTRPMASPSEVRVPASAPAADDRGPHRTRYLLATMGVALTWSLGSAALHKAGGAPPGSRRSSTWPSPRTRCASATACWAGCC